MNKFRYQLWVCSFLVLVSGAISQSAFAMPIQPFNVRVGAITAFQSGGAYSYSGELAWAPELSLGFIGLRANVGGSMLKKDSSGTFFVLDTEGFFCFSILPMITLELGGGLQNWIGYGGSAAIFGGNVVLNLPKIMGLFDRVYAGYSSFQLPGATTSEIHVGFGF